MDVPSSDPISQLSLPPGFRFYPTDEELLVQYLARKVAGHHFTLEVIGEIDLYKYDPWDLPGKATLAGEKEWYFFSPRDRKYPNGTRPNRVAGSGYWKATGTDKLISAEGRNVGIKKALVFYVGRAPKGSKSNWIMHEYRLLHHPRKNGSSRLDDWVLCRIYQKKASAQKTTSNASSDVSTRGGSSPSPSSSSQQVDGVLEALPEMEASFFAPPHTNSSVPDEGEADRKPVDLQRLSSGSFTWANLAAMSSLPQNLNQTQGMHDDNGGGGGGGNCFSFPSMGRPGGVEDEVQSGMRRNWGAGAPSWTAPESRWSPSSLWGFADSLDPSGFRQAGQLLGGFGLTME